MRYKWDHVENPEKLLIYLQLLQGGNVKLWYMECIRYSHGADDYFSGVYTYYTLKERVSAYLAGDLDRFNFRWLPT